MDSNDRNMITRLQLQNEDALELLVDHYLPLIKGVTFKVLAPLKNNGIVEECINDIFLSIWKNSRKFKGNSTDEFMKWMSTIARYKAIDYYRRAKKKVEYSSELLTDVESSAKDELILMEDKAELIELINLLETVDSNIFIVKYFLGLKMEEISLKLGLTTSAIDNRIYRGKKKLYNKAINLNI